MTSLDGLTTERYPMGKHTRAPRTAEFELQPPRKAPTPIALRCATALPEPVLGGKVLRKSPWVFCSAWAGLGEEGPSRGGRRLWRVLS